MPMAAQIDDHAKVIAANLQSAGHPVGAQDIIPVTAETPVPKSVELDKVGAEIVGEDLSHIIDTTVGDLTTGAHQYRITKSGRFLGTLMDKLRRKKG